MSRRIERSRARAPEPRRYQDAQRDEAPSRRARNSDFDQRESRGRTERILDPDEIAESAAALVTRRVAKSERQTAKALENIAELIESGHRRIDPEVIDGAVAAIERRVGETEKKTAKALENLAQLIEAGAKARARDPDDLDVVVDRLGRIESKIAQQPEPASVRPIRGALARLEARIDRLSNDGRANNFEQALSGLDQQLAEIAARLDGDARERQAARSTLNGPSRAAIDHVLDRRVRKRRVTTSSASNRRRARSVRSPTPSRTSRGANVRSTRRRSRQSTARAAPSSSAPTRRWR